MKRGECIPGGARPEDPAHGAGAGCLLEGAHCVAHCGDGDRGLRAAGREDGGETARKGARGICTAKEQEEGKCMRFLAHVADQVRLGEPYKCTVINPGRGGETVARACMAALRSQMVVLRSPLSSVLPFAVLPASRQQPHAPRRSRTISRVSLALHLSHIIIRRAHGPRDAPWAVWTTPAGLVALAQNPPALLSGGVVRGQGGAGGRHVPMRTYRYDAHWRLARSFTASANLGLEGLGHCSAYDRYPCIPFAADCHQLRLHPRLLLFAPSEPLPTWASRRASSLQNSSPISRNTPTVRVFHRSNRDTHTTYCPPVDKRELQQWYAARPRSR